MKLHIGVALLATSVLLVACDDDDDGTTGTNGQTAQVRVVNASSATGGTDVFVGSNSSAAASNVAAGAMGASCFTVPAGSQTLNFRATGGGTTNLASTTAFNFQSGQQYTVVLTGSGTGAGSRSASVLSDNGVTSASAGNNGLRFFNTTGAATDVYVTAPSGTLGTASVSNVANNSASTGGTLGGGFSSFATGNTQVRTFAAGGATTGTPTVNFTLPTLTGNRMGTVVLTGGTGTQAFVSMPCNTTT
ncbi:MAG TPA: DUF4397 domain-containing protein [Gemmatimonadaceae bacterium]|nr:DUF4397 domain-containing protein [Gemmatimonadaceae bacterium]